MKYMTFITDSMDTFQALPTRTNDFMATAREYHVLHWAIDEQHAAWDAATNAVDGYVRGEHVTDTVYTLTYDMSDPCNMKSAYGSCYHIRDRKDGTVSVRHIGFDGMCN